MIIGDIYIYISKIVISYKYMKWSEGREKKIIDFHCKNDWEKERER